MKMKVLPTGAERYQKKDQESRPYMVEKTEWEDISAKVVNHEKCLTFETALYKAHIDLNPFNLRVESKEGDRIVGLTGNQGARWGRNGIYLDLDCEEDESFYGTGLKRVYPLNNTSQHHVIEGNTWNGKSVPYYMSTKGYGLFLNTSLGETRIDFNCSTEKTVSCKVPRCDSLDCYFILGDFRQVSKGYYEITGKPFMLPKWSSGYWAGRYSYRTQEEVLEVGRKFREKEIPCDLLFLDLMWRGAFFPNDPVNLTWDLDCFPEPEAMIKELHGIGFKFFSHVNTTSNMEAEDFSNPEHIQDWKDKIKPLILEGVEGFMVDGGEGKGINENFMGWNISGGRYANGMLPEEMANIWGLLYNKTVIEAMREARPDERMFGLIRVGTAGSQRYGLV